MLTRFVLPLVIAASTSFALAQSTTDKQPPKETPAKQPAKKTTEPAKPTSTDPQEVTLKVGDAAPSIHGVEKWVKGEAVTGFEKGRVYVVEFWATWCGPCIKSIPHLTELQKKHKELTVIGVASSEKKVGDTDTRLENLEKFVKGQDAKMDYRIAYDADRDIAKTWLVAAGQQYIPTAFVVDQEGKIAWIGSPSTQKGDFDAAIEKALKKDKQKGLKKDDKDQTTDAKKPKKDDKDKK